MIDKSTTSHSTATTGASTPLSLEAMQRVMRELELLPQQPWTLIAPDGRVWVQQDPAELLKVLLPFHPLLSPMGQ